MNTTTVRVTDKHIADGEPSDACNCALALAVRDALAAEEAEVTEVMVTDENGGWSAWVVQCDDAGYRRFVAGLDDEAIEFVEAFDAELPVGPIETCLTWEPAS